MLQDMAVSSSRLNLSILIAVYYCRILVLLIFQGFIITNARGDNDPDAPIIYAFHPYFASLHAQER